MDHNASDALQATCMGFQPAVEQPCATHGDSCRDLCSLAVCMEPCIESWMAEWKAGNTIHVLMWHGETGSPPFSLPHAFVPTTAACTVFARQLGWLKKLTGSHWELKHCCVPSDLTYFGRSYNAFENPSSDYLARESSSSLIKCFPLLTTKCCRN